MSLRKSRSLNVQHALAQTAKMTGDEAAQEKLRSQNGIRQGAAVESHESAGTAAEAGLPFAQPSTYLRPLSRVPADAHASRRGVGASERYPMTPADREQIEGLVSALLYTL